MQQQEVTQAVKDFFQMPQLPVAIGCENVPNRLIEMWKVSEAAAVEIYPA